MAFRIWYWNLESGRWLRLLVLEERLNSAPHSSPQNEHCLENELLYIKMKLRCSLQCGPSDEELGKGTPGQDLLLDVQAHVQEQP